MTTIEEVNAVSRYSNYDIPHGAACEYGRDNLVRAYAADRTAGKEQRKNALVRSMHRMVGAALTLCARTKARSPEQENPAS